MSDELEREGLYDKALVNWLKWEAESQMREFMEIHTANAEAIRPRQSTPNETNQ
jgi:hypothetical protein